MTSPSRRLALGLALWWLALAPAGLRAQEAPAVVPEAPTPTEPSLGFESPQATVRGFVTAVRANDWARAAEHLDLRGQPNDAGPRLARQLAIVLERSLWIELNALDDTADGVRDDGLPASRDLVGLVWTASGPAKILVERGTAPDGSQEWRFSRSTVQQIPALYREFGDGRLGDLLPAWLLDVSFLALRLWQWIGLVLLLAVAVLGAWAVTAALARLASPLVRRTSSRLDDALRDLLVGPMRLVVATALISPGLQALRLALPARRVLFGARTALLIMAVTFVALRLIDALARVADQRFSGRGPTAAAVAALVRRTAKSFVIAIAVVLVLGNVGFDVTGILAGLGLGGIAVALGAQKTLEHLFGGVSLIMDAPVRVGDVCRFGNRVGTVVDIGLRSTRIRTVERSVVTVPNAQFSTMELENLSVRDRTLLQANLGLRYGVTPDQVRRVLARLEALLRDHPGILPEPLHVRFTGFGAASLDVEALAYANTSDWDEFLRIRQDVLLRMMDLAAEEGTAFTFPSRPS